MYRILDPEKGFVYRTVLLEEGFTGGTRARLDISNTDEEEDGVLDLIESEQATEESNETQEENVGEQLMESVNSCDADTSEGITYQEHQEGS